jgi:hypothetical protein
MLEYHQKMEIECIQMQISLAFGFIAHPSLTLNHNAFNILCNMPAWYYFDQLSHLAFHDLTFSVFPLKKPALPSWLGA